MARLALIGGHSILGEDPAAGFARRSVPTPDGPVELFERGELILMQRHGLDGYTTARRVDHARNLAALGELGCDRIMAIGSVGGLRRELDVGTFVCPDDFVALHLGLSLSDDHGGERVPGFDPQWRRTILEAWRRRAEPELLDGGTYWQAIGPRFETPAEIRMIAAHADVIGMTIASECILAGELGIPYAAVCVVDNLANGVADAPLSVADFEAGKARNRERLTTALEVVAAELTEVGAGA
ncbi:MAG: MTAP family purine nucleoside phosphorylase [Solirubrobacterales bacterium]|nr:MTAP family purine nucleoside phosphorylase [Solirubrobacterales bacterium]